MEDFSGGSCWILQTSLIPDNHMSKKNEIKPFLISFYDAVAIKGINYIEICLICVCELSKIVNDWMNSE